MKKPMMLPMASVLFLLLQGCGLDPGGYEVRDSRYTIPQEADPEWLKVAKAELGVSEQRGSGQHNQRILEYFRSVGDSWIQSDETPWCGAFVGWSLLQSGEPIAKPRMGSFRAISAQTWKLYGKELTEDALVPGVIIVIYDTERTSEDTRSGYHVGFYLDRIVEDDQEHLIILGGNQSNRVSVKSYPMNKWEIRELRWPRTRQALGRVR
ncbi:MAG TPA: TIGR02594 family protein [Oligoflexus sp.]|uniref:TIGR02594 family protein n=1 Tax=Oligoflexus sp. TaxID=1971216 RepID=UPI002D5F2D0A|nr:TIGR02594 family protein [Oligoflexus sp.]HYX32902.1 TIGR02594 family protein [Oligoflexus sp.]